MPTSTFGAENLNEVAKGTTAIPNQRDKANPEPYQNQPQLVIVDSDLAFWGDDSMALCMLLRSRSVRLLGVTSTSGNVWTEQVTVNLLRFLEVIERPEISVHPGLPYQVHTSRRHYYNEVEKNSWAKGSYAGALARSFPPVIEDPPLGRPGLRPADEPAVDFIIEQAQKYPRQVTLLILGPATNLAAALHKRPHLARELGQVWIIGGAFRAPGNVTKTAEFNFWFDPKSAAAVLKTRIPLTVLPLDASDGKFFDEKTTKLFQNAPNPLEKYVKKYFEERIKRRKGLPIPIWDEGLVGAFLDPSIIQSAGREPIRVITRRGPDYGTSRLSRLGDANRHTIIYRIDTAALQNLICRLFSGPEQAACGGSKSAD